MADNRAVFRYLLAPIAAWAMAQGFKFVREGIRHHRLDFRRLVGTGGMPSSHSALTAALAAEIGKREGVNSALFTLAVVFALVVMYDAAGLRRSVGKQAEALNRIFDDLSHMRGVQEQRLRELVGHTPMQVVIGAALGIATGLLLG